MDTIVNTRLWTNTLARKSSDDAAATPRERFRSCFMSFRERAGLLANEIHNDLPEFTVHDITHLDALWEIADIVVGEHYRLTPAEGFVLGGAFLLHDLGMSLAAYPQGLEELKQKQTWHDTIALQFVERHNRQPTAAEMDSPPPDISTAAMAYLLRSLHAEQAERLAMATWSPSGSDSPQHLVEDTEIRQTFGRIIGLVAHSHWWPVEALEEKFPRTLGAPHWCPKEWTVDPLKLSCLLRLADAGHIDSRRAPYFLRAIRHVSAASQEHWAFQQRISKPHLSGDALCYTSGYAFPFEESGCWWLCFDTLRMIDEELRAVDALLADKGMERFAARRVAGIETAERLTPYIPTVGWTPVDASVQVSDVPRLLTCLGGKELYGRNTRVPLRELVQNSTDALRVRWLVEKRPQNWGQITVRLGEDNGKHWLEVEDNGIGMSPTVLTKYLLDFSTTFWGSSAMIDELPGLLGAGFRPTGKYGIGFFSTFMLGDAVRVRTRRADAAQRDTLVLEFNTGLSSRPVLREATSDEVLRDGGTCIRVWLRTTPTDAGGLLHRHRAHHPASLAQLCREICPSLPVTLECQDTDSTTPIVTGSDWLDIPGEELFRRTHNWSMNDTEDYEDHISQEFLQKAAKNLRVLREADGTPVGRACVGLEGMRLHKSGQPVDVNGAVTVGGLLACHMSGIAGVLDGKSERAARDNAIPVVSAGTLASWATEQASLVHSLYDNPEVLMNCAEIVWRCGGDTRELPVAKCDGSYVSSDEIANMSLPDEVLLVSRWSVSDLEELRRFEFCPGVFLTQTGSWSSILRTAGFYFTPWPDYLHCRWGRDGLTVLSNIGGSVIEAVARAWGLPADELADQAMDRYDRRDDRVVGHVGSQEIRKDVLALRRI